MAEGIIRYMVASMLLSYKKKYGKTYGSIVLACDANTYWRRTKYWWYKGHRKHDRIKSVFDWDVISNTISLIKEEMRENFQYKVIERPEAEADDIIACLCKWSQTNETVTIGLFSDEPQPILICSSDQDFGQLQKYNNVKQYAPAQKKMFVVEGSISDFLADHIARGDSTDNVPSVLTPDQWAIDRASGTSAKRQSPLKAGRVAEFVKNGRDACSSDQERLNYDRNEMLVSFDKIPTSLYDEIINEYTTQKPKGSKMKIYAYLLKHRMKTLIDDAGSF